MLADAGAPDVLIAYPLVGPNLGRLAALIRKFPRTQFSALIDHPAAAEALSSRDGRAPGATVGVVLDLDVGQHRTGIAVGDDAVALYELAATLPGPAAGRLPGSTTGTTTSRPRRPRGRGAAFLPRCWSCAGRERRGCRCRGWSAAARRASRCTRADRRAGDRVLAGHVRASRSRATAREYADLSGITPAAVLVTRVVSRPTANRVTFDLGNKSVASDPPCRQARHAARLPGPESVGHNEEHLIVETPARGPVQAGRRGLRAAGPLCPTVALHRRCWSPRAAR